MEVRNRPMRWGGAPFSAHRLESILADRRYLADLAIVLLLASLTAVVVSPALMPDSYSWIEHAVSKAAAQGVEGAWLARSAFLFAGFSVLIIVSISGEAWDFWGRAGHRLYGVSITAAGIFALGHWDETIPFDHVESFLHSLSAFCAGLGFAVGVVAVLMSERIRAPMVRRLGVVALLSVAVIPLAMLVFVPYAGALQRVLALVGYSWLLSEAVRIRRIVSAP